MQAEVFRLFFDAAGFLAERLIAFLIKHNHVRKMPVFFTEGTACRSYILRTAEINCDLIVSDPMDVLIGFHI